MRLIQAFLIPVFAVAIASSAEEGTPADLWESGGPPVAANSVVVSPVDPSTVYAGTSGTEGGNGVFKSVDAGKHWVAVNQGLPIKRINCIALSPASPERVYVGDEGEGFYRSADGGSHWERLNRNPLHHGTAIAIDPRHLETLYLGTDGGIYKSTDGGVTCEPLHNGLPGSFSVVRIVLDPRHTDTIYIATFNDYEAHCGVWKSIDGGASWRGMSNGLAGGPFLQLPGERPTDTARMIFALAIDPQQPDTLYVGSLGGGVLKTSDGGEHWQHSSDGLRTGTPQGEIIYSLAIDPAHTQTIYAGTAGGGVFVSRDAGGHWAAFSDGLPPQFQGGEMVGIIWNLAISSGKHGYLYAANYGQTNGIYRRLR